MALHGLKRCEDRDPHFTGSGSTTTETHTRLPRYAYRWSLITAFTQCTLSSDKLAIVILVKLILCISSYVMHISGRLFVNRSPIFYERLISCCKGSPIFFKKKIPMA